VRVTTAFNRLLRLPGARVIDVSFTAEGVIVGVALRRRGAACACCGQLVGAVHDRSVRRWRHLDLGALRCLVEYRLRPIVTGPSTDRRKARSGRGSMTCFPHAQ
jgi:transposase